ncbi:hypothetical protein E1283_07005 [Streptomyces hainanensis]|uniref:Uncharacterized protein n=1 Tax=Streptomyces hainanensis TaxID=402648 RepID=A0A4R4TTZ0_9ACTN|nr:hypothetical protein E1283_07005 [Streptomyces hainanensis]
MVMAYEACRLAESARAAVPVGAHELNPDGTARALGAALADAARVLAAARRFVAAAAVFERLGGAGWHLVGDALGLPTRTAREHFAPAEAGFRAELRSTEPRSAEPPGRADWWRSHLVREPHEAALDLDDWVLRHADGETDLGPAPVSGALFAGPHRPGGRRAT